MVKRERDEPENAPQVVHPKGFARGQAHYRHQINLINSVVTPPWTLCFGALGSGVIGVRPESSGGEERSTASTAAAVPPESKPVKVELDDGEESKPVKVEPDDGDGGGPPGGEEAAQDVHPLKPGNDCTPSSSSASAAGPRPESQQVKAEPGGEAENGEALAEHQVTMPANATIVLLTNSKDMNKQTRNGKVLGEYREDSLDPESGTMRWSSQHRDTKNRMLNTIVSHWKRGGRVVVAARGSQDEKLEDKSVFKVLGEVGSITDVRLARCLVEQGDTVIQERGSTTHHKAISPACLDPGLKSGIGLVPVKYRQGQFRGRFCIRCCWEPGCALLHFKELKAEGIAAYIKKEKKEDSSIVKKEEEEPQSHERPAKRLRTKMPRSQIVIKREPVEEAEQQQPPQAAPSEASAEGGAEGTDRADEAVDTAVGEQGLGGFFVKQEPLEAESQAPLLHGA